VLHADPATHDARCTGTGRCSLSAAAGMHRFTWDVHYQPLDGGGADRRPNLPIAAIAHNTSAAPTTPWVNPGQFTVKLTVERQELLAADRRQAGSAREDAGAGDCSRSTRCRRRCTNGALDAQAGDAAGRRRSRSRLPRSVRRRPVPWRRTLAALDKTIETVAGAPAAGGDTSPAPAQAGRGG
jgi:hypothetical protein